MPHPRWARIARGQFASCELTETASHPHLLTICSKLVRLVFVVLNVSTYLSSSRTREFRCTSICIVCVLKRPQFANSKCERGITTSASKVSLEQIANCCVEPALTLTHTVRSRFYVNPHQEYQSSNEFTEAANAKFIRENKSNSVKGNEQFLVSEHF